MQPAAHNPPPTHRTPCWKISSPIATSCLAPRTCRTHRHSCRQVRRSPAQASFRSIPSTMDLSRVAPGRSTRSLTRPSQCPIRLGSLRLCHFLRWDTAHRRCRSRMSVRHGALRRQCRPTLRTRRTFPLRRSCRLSPPTRTLSSSLTRHSSRKACATVSGQVYM